MEYTRFLISNQFITCRIKYKKRLPSQGKHMRLDDLAIMGYIKDLTIQQSKTFRS